MPGVLGARRGERSGVAAHEGGARRRRRGSSTGTRSGRRRQPSRSAASSSSAPVRPNPDTAGCRCCSSITTRPEWRSRASARCRSATSWARSGSSTRGWTVIGSSAARATDGRWRCTCSSGSGACTRGSDRRRCSRRWTGSSSTRRATPVMAGSSRARSPTRSSRCCPCGARRGRPSSSWPRVEMPGPEVSVDKVLLARASSRCSTSPRRARRRHGARRRSRGTRMAARLPVQPIGADLRRVVRDPTSDPRRTGAGIAAWLRPPQSTTRRSSSSSVRCAACSRQPAPRSTSRWSRWDGATSWARTRRRLSRSCSRCTGSSCSPAPRSTTSRSTRCSWSAPETRPARSRIPAAVTPPRPFVTTSSSSTRSCSGTAAECP